MNNLKVRKLWHCNSIKKKNYLGIILTKETQDLHTENDKTLVKETEGPKSPQHVGGLDSRMRLTVVKDSNPPQRDLQVQCDPNCCFSKTGQLILTSTWNRHKCFPLNTMKVFLKFSRQGKYS